MRRDLLTSMFRPSTSAPAHMLDVSRRVTRAERARVATDKRLFRIQDGTVIVNRLASAALLNKVGRRELARRIQAEVRTQKGTREAIVEVRFREA